jgi:Aldehyde dehydrogenase family
MPHLDACLGILRRLIAKGDPDQLSQTERAVDEYWDATRPGARKSGLWFIQQDDLVQATRAPTSEDDVPFALFALERMMFIRAFDKACWDLSAGAIIGSIHLLRWPAGHAGGRRCRLVGLGQDHRDLPATDGPSRRALRRPHFSARFTIDNRASTVGGLSREVRVGQVFINGYGAGCGIELPFGGMKKSGQGREKGFEALYELAAMKTLVVKHG